MTNRNADIAGVAEARLGTVLRGKYRLDRVLGVGGMAVVYKATHRNQAQFAVKMLHPELSINADIRSRFLREGYAANSVKHPGAVLVVDDDTAEDGAAFLVMELLDGIGCEEVWACSGQRLAPEAASAIVVQLLDVLAAAHAKGIIHRDIKPANLFLTRNGAVKVLDFGIARAREAMASGAHATGTGMMLGTPAFMAPEQALGRSREIDGRTDLWAAGATFFSLVSGQFPHTGETGQELMVRAATLPARSLSAVAPHVSPSIVEIIDRALAFRREDRWESAEAMRDALMKERGAATPEAIVASLVPGSSRPAPPAERTIESGRQAQASSLERAAPARSGPTAALTTSAPMSSDRQGPMPVRSRRWTIGAGVGLGLATVVGVFFVRIHAHPVPDPGIVASHGPVVDVPGPVAKPDPVRDAQAPEVVVNAGALTQPIPSARVVPPPANATSAAARSPKPNPKQLKVEPKPASLDCDPNYTLDEQGQKHFKSECFLKK